MSVDSKKTILLEKKYLYVRASLGFQLEGTSTEVIPTNNGFYRFYVDNLSKALGNSYVNILYDSSDLSFQSFCSDLYMDELMSSDSSAIEDVVEELKKNTTTIEGFENGVSSALESNHQDNVALNSKLDEFQAGVSSAMASNHLDNVAIVDGVKDLPLSLHKDSSVFNAGSGLYFPFLIDLNRFMVCPPRSGYTSSYTPVYVESFTVNREISQAITLFAYYPCSVDMGGSSLVLRFTVHFSDGTILVHGGSTEFYNAWPKSSFPKSIYFSSYEITDSSYFGKVISSVDITINPYSNTDFERLRLGSYFKDDFSIVHYCKDSYLLRILASDVSDPCLNLNFDFDFNGGYLDFQVESTSNYLSALTYTFITDVGNVSFYGSKLGFVKEDANSNLYVCGTLPNVVIQNSTIHKLLGLRVKKT